MNSPFEGILTSLTRQRGVLGGLVAGENDGIIVDANVQVGIEADVLAALVAALYHKARLCSEAAGLSTIAFLQLDAERGHVCAVGRDGLVLMAFTEPHAHVGPIRAAMLQSVEALV